MRKKLKRKLKLIITFAVISGVFFSIHAAINSNAVQSAIIGLFVKEGVNIKPAGLKLNILKRKITAKSISVENAATGLNVSAKDINIKLSLLGLARGKLVMPKLFVGSADIVLPAKTPEKKREKISIKKLFLLQNLFIEDCRINNAVIHSSDNGIIFSDMLSFQFKPKFAGDVELNLNLQGINYKKGAKQASLAMFALKGRTKLTDWSDAPPYLNSVHGKVSFQDLRTNDVHISNFESGIEMKGKKITVSNFKLVKDSKPVEGLFFADIEEETFKGDIKIPEPLKFPRLGSKSPTFDTSGFIKGEIKIEGKGFSLKDSTGLASILLSHEREGLIPINIESAPTWKNGIIAVNGTKVALDKGMITADGTVNVAAKKFDIDFKVENAPLQAAFGRFYDINFHPIFGIANGNAKLTGWAKNFTVTAKAETVAPSGYYKITAEKVLADINATYNDFSLRGSILQRGKETGNVGLMIRYGKKLESGIREKDIHLTAKIQGHDLDESFSEYKLAGLGKGSLTLNGPPKSYKGRISAEISNGALSGISFTKVFANADMSYKKIKFTDGEFILPNIEPAPFSKPIQMDFYDGGFHFFGSPFEGVVFDTDYKSKTDTWAIKNITFHDLKVKGSYSPKGSSDLKINGAIGGAHLQAFKEHFREAEGTFNLELEYSGISTNPSLNGNIILDGNTIFPRAIGIRLENVYGELSFNGHTVRSDYLTGSTETGDFVAKGEITHQNLEMNSFNIDFNANSFRYATDDGAFKAEVNADVSWKGTKDSSLLQGEVAILDGRYTKDFILLEGIVRKQEPPPKKEGVLSNDTVKLDLKIRNAGDLMIKNNIGEVWLKTDVIATGTAKHPQVTGAIETIEGKLRFFGKEFLITRGYIEYRAPSSNPYLEITAEHEVPTITDLVITATLHGRLDNLVLDLNATKPLEKRDIVSLLLFGVTETEIKEAQWSYQFGPSVAAAQVSHLLERPISKLAHLDIFRIEAGGGAETTGGENASQSTQISRMYLGKKLTDRLTVEFVTDVNTEDAQQTLKAEYLLTDFLILKGERSSGQKYKLNVLLRFKER